MAKTMKMISVITLLLTICLYFVYEFTMLRTLIPFIITFGTTAYHFIIRLIIGMVVDIVMHNKAGCQRKWYQVSDFEMGLYQKMKVKSWKNNMPTYNADTFDISKHSWDEISIWFDSFWVFLITSICGAIFDLMFVCIQRFNRTRILKMKR